MPATDPNVVRTFWHGSDLSAYEELALASFVKLGHTVQIFAYQRLRAIEGVEQVDAASILPETEVFSYRDGPGKGSFSAFSNLFRYKLLHEIGGIWADADILCLKPFTALPLPCVGWQGEKQLNSAIMRFPPGHPITIELYERAREMGRDIHWGQTGPRLLSEVVLRNRGKITIMPQKAFYPISWRDAWKLLSGPEDKRCETAVGRSYCVHWWNEILRRIGLPKDKLPPAGSYLHRHACRILGENRWQAWPAKEVETRIADYLASRPTPPAAESLVQRLKNRLKKAAAFSMRGTCGADAFVREPLPRPVGPVPPDQET